MKVFHARLSIEGLNQLPSADRKLFFALANLQNEIRFLLRIIQWSADYSSPNEAVVHGQFALNFFNVKLLAGKLREGYEILNKFYFPEKDLVLRFQDKANPETLDALKELKRYFSKGNLLHEVRNNFAFHFSPDALENELGKSPDPLDLYIENGPDANTLYYFAEVLSTVAALREIGSPDPVFAMGEFTNVIFKAATTFNKFNLGFLHFITSENKEIIWDGHATEIDLGELPSFAKVRIPWFADTSQGLQ